MLRFLGSRPSRRSLCPGWGELCPQPPTLACSSEVTRQRSRERERNGRSFNKLLRNNAVRPRQQLGAQDLQQLCGLG